MLGVACPTWEKSNEFSRMAFSVDCFTDEMFTNGVNRTAFSVTAV